VKVSCQACGVEFITVTDRKVCSYCKGLADKLEEMAVKEDSFSLALWEQGDKPNAYGRDGVSAGFRLAKRLILGELDERD
jgi:hypothetical protein